MSSSGSVELKDLEQKLTILQSHTDSVERKLGILRLVADSSWERTMKGQDFYENIESKKMRT